MFEWSYFIYQASFFDWLNEGSLGFSFLYFTLLHSSSSRKGFFFSPNESKKPHHKPLSVLPLSTWNAQIRPMIYISQCAMPRPYREIPDYTDYLEETVLKKILSEAEFLAQRKADQSTCHQRICKPYIIMI